MNELKMIEASIEKDIKDWISGYGLYMTNKNDSQQNDNNNINTNGMKDSNSDNYNGNNSNSAAKKSNDLTNQSHSLIDRESSFYIRSKNLTTMVYQDVLRWGKFMSSRKILLPYSCYIWKK